MAQGGADRGSSAASSVVAVGAGAAAIGLGATAAAVGDGAPVVAAVVALLLAWALVRSRPDRTTVVGIALAVLLLVPARYRIEALGSAGTPASLLGLLALAVWGFGFLTGHPRLTRGTNAVRGACLVLLWAVLTSYVLAGLRSPDDLLSRAADRGLMTVLSTVSFTLLVGELVRGRAAIRRVVAWIAASGSVVAFLGVLQFAIGVDVAGLIRPPGFTYSAVVYDDSRAGFSRIVSTVSHPIELAVVLVMLLPLLLWLFFSSTGRSRWGWAGCLAVTAAAVPMTVSRTGVAGLVVLALVLVPSWTWRRRIRAGAVALVGLVAFSAVVPGLLGTLRSMILDPGGDPSLVSRQVGRAEALASIGEHPLFGLGFGTYLPERYGYLDNQLLGTLVETGVVGLAAFAVLFGTIAALGLRVVRRATGRHREDDRALAVALLAALAVSVATWATYDALGFPTVRALTFVVMGLLVAAWRTLETDTDEHTDTRGGAAGPVAPSREHETTTGER